jgi:hypothetical protein
MNKYPNYDYAYLYLLDYGVYKSFMLEQNYVDMMIQHG